jgi:hypothetical protein
MVGAGVTVTGIASAETAARSVERILTAEEQLSELTTKYIEAAKLIDPRIKGGWVGRDLDADNAVYFVHLERDTARFIQKARKPAQTEIGKLFAKWRKVRDRDCAGWETNAEAEANYAEYRRLQVAIVESGLVPTSAQELAMQFIVDTDFTGSDWSTHWENIVFGLIGEPIDGVVS